MRSTKFGEIFDLIETAENAALIQYICCLVPKLHSASEHAKSICQVYCLCCKKYAVLNCSKDRITAAVSEITPSILVYNYGGPLEIVPRYTG
ncbi:hypothetical protein AVEN_265430-1 [Araneus ventricosus]|uniref:Uncharacterized protein n=1 Tax=Araneus ventricosus TaxID=182803 RepID=A0A4Y2R4Z4_ARAVE|nr:hypothetical protein AVEN_265430-1 [Araneus ventricosus]